MRHHRRAFLYPLAAASFLLAVGCAGSGVSVWNPDTPVPTISANPSSFGFALNQTTPQAVTVTRSSGSFTALAAVAADPDLVGVSVIGISGATATVDILPIASLGTSTTSVTLTDSSGATTALTITPATCGRPSDLSAGTELISPTLGATHVPTNVGTLYFTLFSPSPQFPTNIRIHLVVGGTATLEGTSALILATPPGGAPSPAPLPPGLYEYVAAGTVPTLPTGTSIRTQLYDDACQGPLIPGNFST